MQIKGQEDRPTKQETMNNSKHLLQLLGKMIKKENLGSFDIVFSHRIIYSRLRWRLVRQSIEIVGRVREWAMEAI